MVIDVHAHYLPAELSQRLETLLDRSVAAFSHADDALDRMVAEAEAHGVGLQVLSANPIHPYHPTPARARQAAVAMNNFYASVVSARAERFAAFAALPLPHVEEALAEVARCDDELPLVGFTVGCSVLGQALNDPSFEPLWDELDRRAAVVFVHPGGVFLGTEPSLAGMDAGSLAAITIGSGAEVATAALCAADIARRRPKIRWIFANGGGVLTFLWQRISELAGRRGGEDGPALLATLRTFFYDTSMHEEPASLLLAQDAVGMERVLLGSDAPRCGTEAALRLLENSSFLTATRRGEIAERADALLAPAIARARGRLEGHSVAR